METQLEVSLYGFSGMANQTIDGKGRISIPVKLIRALHEAFVVTEGAYARCLVIYPISTWQAKGQVLAQVPASDAAAQKAIRRMFATALSCDVDNSGRIQLTDHLRSYARLDKDIIIIGANNRVEIWAKEIWDEVMTEDLDTEADLSSLSAYGI